MAHTKGPWKVVRSGTRVEILSDFDTRTFKADYAIAHVYSNGKCNGRSYRAPVDDNARLIAAAPDLLDACRAIVEATGEDLEHAIILANEAIEKAEGKQ